MKEDYCSEKTLEELNKKCIWIPDEEEGKRCQQIEGSCEEIDREKTCEYFRKVEVKEEEGLKCFWVSDGNAHSQRCVFDNCSRFSIDDCLQHDYEGILLFFSKFFFIFFNIYFIFFSNFFFLPSLHRLSSPPSSRFRR
jgi:hypothetical protein